MQEATAAGKQRPKATKIDQIIIATTQTSQKILTWLNTYQYNMDRSNHLNKPNYPDLGFFIGSENDVMSRILDCADLYNIDVIVDVRSAPYSRYVKQFNKENLEGKLKNSGISYIYMGNKLGARYNNPDLLYPNGTVNYGKVKRTNRFNEGIKTVIVEGTYTTELKNVNIRIFIDRTYIDTGEAHECRARDEQDEYLEKVLKIEHDIISSHKTQADIIVTRDYDVNEYG